MREEVIFVHPETKAVWVTGFAWDDPARPSRLTDREYLETCMERLSAQEGLAMVPKYRIAPEGESAREDWYFRDAWRDVDFTVDMEKARAIHLANIRSVRNAELEKLDIPFMRAVETGDQAAISKIAKQKQLLRDIPQKFDLVAGSPTELKGKWPTELPARPTN